MAFIPGVSHAPGSPPPLSGGSIVQTKPVNVILQGSAPAKPQPDIVVETPVVPDFTFGTPSAGSAEVLGNKAEAKVGDNLRFTYRLKIPWFQQWQVDYLVNKLSGDERYHLDYVALYPEQRKAVIEVTVVKPMSPILIVVGIIAAAVVGATIYMTLDKVERLSTVKVAGFQFSVAPLLLLLALGAGILYLRKAAA